MTAPAEHTGLPDCQHCLAPAPRTRSEKVAWAVAGVAVVLLVAVYFLGIGSRAGNFLAGGGIVLASVLICPLVMGGMMFFMMRKGH